jgi:hypothetical protein
VLSVMSAALPTNELIDAQLPNDIRDLFMVEN